MENNKILLVLALGVFGITTTEFGVIGILPEMASVFKISIDKAGLLLSTFAIIVAVFGPIMVVSLSSFDRKKVLAFSLFVFAVCNVLSAFATNFNLLLIIRMLPAFFHPVYWSIALAIAVESVPSDQASKATSIIFSGLTIATVLGVPLTTLLVDLLDWQSSFIVLAGLNVVSFAGLLWRLPSTKKTTVQKVAYSKKLLLQKPVLWINVLLAFCIITAMYSTYGYMADFLKSVTKMNGKEISMMLFLFGTTGIIGNRLAGKLMNNYPFQTTLVFIIALTCVHLLLFVYGNSFYLMLLITAMWGLIHTGGFLISNVNVVSSVTEAKEFVNSIFTSCGNFAVTVGSILGGYWIVHFGIRQVIWSSIICLMLSLVMIFVKKRFE